MNPQACRCAAALPPEGALRLPWGGPAYMNPQACRCAAALPPEGALRLPWGGPAETP